ncbi:hypothetical protein PC128_g9498 [Phytophthora cactorum]|nr:hypothetical protein PC128_g9498 [Phytophthora cactorum]
MISLSPPSPSSSTSGSQQPVVDPQPPVRRGGRPQDPIWDEVLVEDGIVSCLKCVKIIHTSGKGHVERVRYHFDKKCSKRLKTPLVTSVFRPAMTPAKVCEFHKLFAMWFYSTGMAFNKAAHHTLAAALRLLTLSDIVPTRQQLAGDLLNVWYDDFRSKMMLKIADRRCTGVTDTWTDINGKAVINYGLVFEDMTVFFESVYSGSDLHDAPYLASDIERVMAKLSFVMVAAVVTDNTATNQLVWSKLQQKHPTIFFHGCISHALHLTVKDLVQRLPWLGKLEENCRKLVRFFKKNQQRWYELKQLQHMEGKLALVLPADTRWGTIERCFASVHQSEKILHAFVTLRDFLRGRNKEKKAKRRHTYDTVVAKDFVKQLEKALTSLSVLSAFQKAFEKDTKPPSDVYRMFLELSVQYNALSIPISDHGKIRQILKERFDFIYGDAHGVVYLLDPRYHGQTWMTARKSKTAAKQSVEVTLVHKKKLSVFQNWNGRSQFPLLRDIALTVFSASCSSAAAERNFSAHKFVHSQARNRFQDASVKKLVFMFFNAN